MDAYTESIQKSPLLGEETVTVDGKFRVLFSKKKRDRLGENFVLAIGLKGCLEALPRATFDQMTAEILAAPPLNMGRQEYASMLARNSDDDQNFDSEGRVLIPVGLRAKGKIAQKGKLVLKAQSTAFASGAKRIGKPTTKIPKDTALNGPTRCSAFTR